MSSGKAVWSDAERRYGSVLYICHHISKHAGNVHDYFRGRAALFHVFSFTPIFQDRPCVLERYARGELEQTREYGLHGRSRIVARSVFYFFYYLHVVLFVIPRGTTIITPHPFFCVLHGVFRLLRGHRTVYWVYDYFPRRDGSFFWYNLAADFYAGRMREVLFLGPELRKVYGGRVRPRKGAYRDTVVHGFNVAAGEREPDMDTLGFIGQLKRGQGLELVFGALALEPSLKLEVVGDGADRGYFEECARKFGVWDRVGFFGFVEEGNLASVTGRWLAGLAPYEPVDSSVATYAHPGKVALYLQCGLPVIMTRVTHLHPEISRCGAGRVIGYSVGELLEAVADIRGRYPRFVEGVARMGGTFPFRRYYDEKLGFLREREPAAEL